MFKKIQLKDVHKRIPPSLTWVAVFAPALAYFLSTRLHRFTAWGGNVGEPWSKARLFPIQHSKEVDPTTTLLSSCEDLRKLFGVTQVSSSSSSCTSTGEFGLPISVREVLGGGSQKLHNVVASVWRHDSDLGRGYLLLSDSSGNGRIWRWEVGGGPITIGRTLHLEQSGCRSNFHRLCHSSDDSSRHNQTAIMPSSAPLGSGGMTIDFSGKDHFAEGRLIVAEWGEGRIVRIEESGARTPLVLQVPDICQYETDRNATTRLHRPSQLLLTPKGDLLFVDHSTSSCNIQSSLFRLSRALHVDSLESLSISREAHSWKSLDIMVPEIVPLGPMVVRVGGMAVAQDWSSILVVARHSTGQCVLMKVNMEEDDDNEGDDTPDGSERVPKPNVLVDLTTFLAGDELPGGLAVSQDFIFVLLAQGILVIDPNRQAVIGKLELGTLLTSITLGEDGYLYMSSPTSLFRTRIHSKVLKPPTDVWPKRPKNRAR